MAERSPDARMITLGVVTRPHGVRGELRVHPFNEDSDVWRSLREVGLRDGDAVARYRVLRATRAPKHVILQLEGVAGREAADALRGRELVVPRTELPEPDEDELYLDDLVGLRVLQDGADVGEVLEVISYPSVACLRVRSADAVREVPLVPPWLVDVDLDAGVVHVGPWDDLPCEAPP